MTDLAVVGGGAAGVLTAAAAVRAPGIARVVLIDRGDRLARGTAYGAADPHHRLNSPAGRMGALQDDPGGFVRWSSGVGDPLDDAEFAPRTRYGDYLADVFADLPVDVVRAEAVDLRHQDDRVVVALDHGAAVAADVAVLALGTPPPPGRGGPGRRSVPDPWAPGALDDVAGRVLLVGTGLTAVDVATTLARSGRVSRMTATSRHGLLPRVHLDRPQPAGPGIAGEPDGLAAVIRGFRRRLAEADAAGSAWQAEVDGVRPQVDALWTRLSQPDRRRFLRHVSRDWEVHRHRMSPVVARELQQLLDDGRLEVAEPHGEYDVVIDCTGSRPFASRGWNRLVDALLDTGAVRPDELGIGLDVDRDGRVVGADGAAHARVFAIGAARRGVLWETTAIPEIRAQATALAALVGGRA